MSHIALAVPLASLVVFLALELCWRRYGPGSSRSHGAVQDWWAEVPAAEAAYVLGCFGGKGSYHDAAKELGWEPAETLTRLHEAIGRGWAAQCIDGEFCVLDGNLREAQHEATGAWS